MNSSKSSMLKSRQAKQETKQNREYSTKNALQIMQAINRVQTRTFKNKIAKQDLAQKNNASIVAAIVKVQSSKNRKASKYTLKKKDKKTTKKKKTNEKKTTKEMNPNNKKRGRKRSANTSSKESNKKIRSK